MSSGYVIEPFTEIGKSERQLDRNGESKILFLSFLI